MYNDINIILSGFSGEGIQFMGYHLSYVLYKTNFYIKTYNNIPSEIYSPTKTITDISEFIIRFSKKKIISYYKFKRTILIVTNYLSLKKNIKYIKKNSLLILDFNKKNYLLLKNDIKINKIIQKTKKIYLNSKKYIKYNILIEYKIKKLSDINLYKNSILLGILLYILNIPIKYSKFFFKKKNKKKNIYLLNYYLLKLGFKIGVSKIKYKINLKINNILSNKKYKIINGNLGIVLGLISSSLFYNIGIFFSSYPITPSITISKYLKKNINNINIKFFEAEDEISAICTSIGASIYNNKYIGVTATSGPGMSLLQESLGLAVVLEIPLIIINVQRVGPSTGYPTKLEQSDLMQAIYGRHGEAPIPVFALNNINNTIKLIYYIFKISLELMTPIIVLSDIYISSNLSLWKINKYKLFKKKNYKIKVNKKLISNYSKNKFKCIGGLIKNINLHKKQIKKRQNKINYILNKYINLTYIYKGNKKGKILVISWGSNYEIIKESIYILINKKYKIGYLHLISIYPLPSKIIEKISKNYNKIIIFELNNKQLIYIIKSYCKIYIDIKSNNKLTGDPFTILDIKNYIIKNY
ncbi:MAG: 2-oxoacid:acceptor oxidoreductase family protein [Candidatus Shikimatogenerans sp. JK-2022]|nr:2-oxoacid:acceptor oxidoreductase family protein [Candidatus Shikimatogenerans bostrichidophilus]